jgi:hypothetical protein
MGDVTTHGKIASSVMPLLGAPEAALFEIGNWLTDVSQFRDPFAHLSGKKRIFSQGLDKIPPLRLFNVGDLLVGWDNYLDEIMGKPPESRVAGTRPGANPASDRPDDGKLATWFRAAMLLWTVNGARLPPLIHDQGLSAFAKADIKAVYDALYTQYFPHEHLDFPPYPPDKPQRGTRTDSTSQTAGGQPRLTYDYTETQLQYVADLLTRVERDWAHNAGGDPGVRRELVARFGHASHAIEDWYFHSNFVELAWQIVHGNDPAPHEPLTEARPEEIESLGPLPTETGLQRRHHRRLRKPSFDGDSDDLSADTSEPADRIYTGSFGSNDIFFTLIDALGHMFGTPPPMSDRIPILGTFHRLLFGTEEERKTELKKYQEKIKNGTFVSEARALATAGVIEQFEADAIEEMCAIEKTLLEDYSLLGLGVMGFLQLLMDFGRGTVRKSLNDAATIDNDPAHRINDNRSDNGSPGENIGSHSLMSKDSVRKEPMRVAAVNLGTYVATYVAKTMVSRTPAQSPAQPDDFVDWLELLHYFIGHPAQAAGGAGSEWWRALVQSIDPRPPEGHTVILKPLAQLPSSPDETHLAAAELPYYDASLYAEAQFTKAVDVAMVVDSIYTGAITGGIVGMIDGAIAGGKHGTAQVFEGMGLGLIIGAAIGAAGGGLGATIGLAISRHAGVVVGSFTGIVGGSVAAGFAAAAVGNSL